MENGRLDDHVASFAKASAFAKATADESEAKEQVEQVDGGEGLGGVEGVQKFQKIGQTIFLESGGLAGRQFAGFDGVDGAAGDKGSRDVEEVGFGFGVDGGEFIVVAKEVEKICAKILQAFKHKYLN